MAAASPNNTHCQTCGHKKFTIDDDIAAASVIFGHAFLARASAGSAAAKMEPQPLDWPGQSVSSGAARGVLLLKNEHMEEGDG